MTAEDLRRELETELDARQAQLKLYSDYYDGEHRLSFATSKFKEAFGDLFEAFATNWCGLVVDVAVERLIIMGFRFGEDGADDEAWRIWQASNLDHFSVIAHTEAVKLATCYLLVSPPKSLDLEPRITVEHPTQVICRHDPEDHGRVIAALKRYRAADGATIAVVYEPDRVTTFRKDSLAGRVEALGIYIPTGAGGEWQQIGAGPNRLGVVPIIPLENSPDLLRGGMSDLKPAIALNDAANKFFTDMIHASEFTSFPQRVLTGVEIPRDPITGEVADATQIRAAVNRLWAFEAPDANVSQLSAGDLSSYVEGVDMAVQHLAAQTRTPPHYLLAKLVNISGDALIAAETGLEARCKRKHLSFSDPWELALRLCFKWRSITRKGWVGADEDEYRSELEDAETIWADPGKKDPVSLTQSLSIKQSIGVPQEVLWEEAGYTPQQIRRMLKLRDEERERQAALGLAGEEAAPSVGVAEEGGNMAVSGFPGPKGLSSEPQAA